MRIHSWFLWPAVAFALGLSSTACHSTPPEVDAIIPAIGSVEGGTRVTLEGTALFPGVEVALHKLVDAPALSTEWSKADFAELVTYIAASGVEVATVDQVLANDRN